MCGGIYNGTLYVFYIVYQSNTIYIIEILAVGKL